MSSYTSLTDWCCPLLGHRFQTIKDVAWELGAKGSGLWVRVPAGYVFDVSVPRLLRWITRPDDLRLLKAACLHDYALAVLRWDRVTSAAAFSEALRAAGFGRFRRLFLVFCVIAWRWN